VVVWFTWPDVDLTLPLLSKVAPVGLKWKNLRVFFFGVGVLFEI